MIRYYSLIIILVLSVLPSVVFAANDLVEKTDCKLAISYDSMDELKADLLLSAKRLAVNELFGELIAAATAVEDFVVTSDQIRTSSLGLVREDTIRYFNGDNLGEVCITITVYTTDEDRKQFIPIKLNKRNCVSAPDLTARELRKFAEEEAIIKALQEYNRKLEGQDRARLLNLLQRVTYLESGMLPDTDTYCVRLEGYVKPIEVITLLAQGNSTTELKASKQDSPPENPKNIAMFGTVSASSSYGGCYKPANTIDGIAKGYPSNPCNEWASAGEREGAWLQVDFETSVRITSIVLYDRPNTADHIVSARLIFSDGTIIPVTGIPNNGAARSVVFEEKIVKWVRLLVDEGKGPNVGVSEIEIYGQMQ